MSDPEGPTDAESPAVPGPDVRVYRMAPPVVARLVGSFLVVVALVLFVATAVVYAARLPPDLLVLPLVVGVGGSFGLGWWLRSRAWVLRLDPEGYAVRLVRGARVTDATWSQVREVVTTTPGGHPCLVLRLHDETRSGGPAGETVIPVEAVEGDREELVREVRRRLAAR